MSNTFGMGETFTAKTMADLNDPQNGKWNVTQINSFTMGRCYMLR